ncbi:MAG: acyloxyacyl hydrolase [Gammaproteobacteria bacterium]|nr:acyloxyacyl hydrolase [Gammaproteobacteria bacterium]
MFSILVLSIISADACSANDQPARYEIGVAYERAIEHFPGWSREQVIARFPLSWNYDISQTYTLRSYLESSIGYIYGDGEDHTSISMGGGLRLDPNSSARRVYLLLGFSPTLLSDVDFGNKEIGTRLEFSTQLALGIYLDSVRTLAVEFSLRHTSNGGLSQTNPGVNSMGLTVLYRF